MKEAVVSARTRKDEPAYKRIQTAIRERIDSGELKPGDVVYSERELAKIRGVSLMTARHALAGLAYEGIVERRHGAALLLHRRRFTSTNCSATRSKWRVWVWCPVLGLSPQAS
jgi:DNA-binding GntR family transcriptional regulator